MKRARVLCKEYAKFLLLKMATRDYGKTLAGDQGDYRDTLLLSPPVVIDAVWHLHILDTRRYAADMKTLFGEVPEHDPDGPCDPRSLRMWRAESTVLAYRLRFGADPLEHTLSWWCFSSDLGDVWEHCRSMSIDDLITSLAEPLIDMKGSYGDPTFSMDRFLDASSDPNGSRLVKTLLGSEKNKSRLMASRYVSARYNIFYDGHRCGNLSMKGDAVSINVCQNETMKELGIEDGDRVIFDMLIELCGC